MVGLGIVVWLTVLPVSVRGKFMGSGRSITSIQETAQAAALADTRVQAYIDGNRADVFGVAPTGAQRPADSACGDNCQQVNIYDFDAGATIIALVDGSDVTDVLYQEHNRPMPSQQLASKATDIALNHPDIIAELGFQPERVSMSANDGGMHDGCAGDHVCVAATFEQEGRNLWAVIDLTTEELAGLFWTTLRPNPSNPQPRNTRPACPAPGVVTRAGWSVNYETSPSDGTVVFDVTFNGMRVLTSAKNVEWHVDYGAGGFTDSIGCGVSGASFPVAPYGETEVRDLVDGFELVQDYRMLAWGQNCNYRYEQKFQFYNDGRFQILSGAYGRGCGSDTGSEPIYRSVMRVDIAINDDANNTLSILDSEDGSWQTQPFEKWWQHDGTQQWQISDPTNIAFDMQPTAENAGYIYVTRHRPSEGDIDLGIFDSTIQCCTDSHEQGPNDYIDGDITADSNIVLWYVPQFESDSQPGSEFCWTEQGDPDPIVYPCFGGLLFTPRAPIPTAVNLDTAAPQPASRLIPITAITLTALATALTLYTWRKKRAA